MVLQLQFMGCSYKVYVKPWGNDLWPIIQREKKTKVYMQNHHEYKETRKQATTTQLCAHTQTTKHCQEIHKFYNIAVIFFLLFYQDF